MNTKIGKLAFKQKLVEILEFEEKTAKLYGEILGKIMKKELYDMFVRLFEEEKAHVMMARELIEIYNM
ncbi:MAG: hypothetical protein QXP42_04505 [Candidatus Micrarchaeia archaeon]